MITRLCVLFAMLSIPLLAWADKPPSADSAPVKSSRTSESPGRAVSRTAETDPIDKDLLDFAPWFRRDVAGATAEVNRLKEKLGPTLAGTWRMSWLNAWQHEIDIVSQLSKERRERLVADIIEARNIEIESLSVADHAPLEARVTKLWTRVDEALDDRCPSILLVLDIRSNMKSLQADYQGALQDRERVRALRTAYLGDWNPLHAVDIESVALSLGDLGKFAEAKKLLLECLEYRLAAYGPKRGEVLVTTFNLATIAVRESRYEEATTAFGEILLRKGWSPESEIQIYSKCLHQLGIVYGRTGRHLEAEASFQMSLTAYRKYLAPTHPHVLTVLGDQLRFYEESHQETKAAKLREELNGLRPTGSRP